LNSEEEKTMKPTGSNSFEGRGIRLPRSLNESLEKRVASYAAAARADGVGSSATVAEPEKTNLITYVTGAAGAGLLLAAAPASARIVYTPTYTAIPVGFPCSTCGPLPVVPLDLNHDGINDFSLAAETIGDGGDFHKFTMSVTPDQKSNGILGKIQTLRSYSQTGPPGTCHVASALAAGHRIGAGSRFGPYAVMAVAAEGDIGFYQCGYWGGAQGRFLGLEFTVQGQKHFGWARLNGRTLTGYAYETVPSKPIRAGQTGPVADNLLPELRSAPPSSASLQPPGLGLLALGWRGLDAWRKELEPVV
jgi:hypothetical protein